MIQKRKPCKECSRIDFIWSRGRCKPCAIKSYKKPKPISDKRSMEIVTYSRLRKEYLMKYPNCQAKLIGCMGKATDIHHTNGRENDRLNDTKDWLSLCRSCHAKIHDSLSAAEARRLGLKK